MNDDKSYCREDHSPICTCVGCEEHNRAERLAHLKETRERLKREISHHRASEDIERDRLKRELKHRRAVENIERARQQPGYKGAPAPSKWSSEVLFRIAIITLALFLSPLVFYWCSPSEDPATNDSATSIVDDNAVSFSIFSDTNPLDDNVVKFSHAAQSDSQIDALNIVSTTPLEDD